MKLTDLPRQRLIEWWAVLNYMERPLDLPKSMNASDVFSEIERIIPKEERLAFWNGDFKRGLNATRYKSAPPPRKTV